LADARLIHEPKHDPLVRVRPHNRL
jgi:hypothetical protein